MKKLITYFITIFLVFFACGANAETKIVSIAMDSSGIPFLLDNKGDVWSFTYPLLLEDPIKIPNLHHIKKIAPFIALSEDGHVYNWKIESQYDFDSQKYKVSYSEPNIVENLNNITDIASENMTFIAIKDNYIYEWHILESPPIADVLKPELTALV